MNLKSCPKENNGIPCNGIALLHSEYEVFDDNPIQEYQTYLVKCSKCSFSGGDWDSPKKAIKYWNLRSKSNSKS